MKTLNILLGFMGLGGLELLIIISIFAIPVIIAFIFYKLGKKAGYNQGKAEVFEKRNL